MIPQKTIKAIQERSNGCCSWPGCCRLDWRGVQVAHIKHRGMGGHNGEAEKLINDPRNLTLLCCYHHDVFDMRVWEPELRREMLAYFKTLLGWDSWAQECREKNIYIGRIE